ncbi:MAG: tol-pal system protein YbgF [Nannocystaceae bacterium]|nr:tol-pal system protein YbgF [Nannocystaceae bacterium]
MPRPTHAAPKTRGPLAAPRLALCVLALLPACAHGGRVTSGKAPTQAGEDESVIDALRRDNAAMRRRLAELEDRVVRLEHDVDSTGVPDDRELPVVRLRPRHAEPQAQPEAAPPRARRVSAKTLGDMPNSGAPDEAWDEGDDAGSVAAAEPTRGGGEGGSYRLVGSHLVQMTKEKAPKRPDRPPRDAEGTAVVTEYETAMALYKAGEVAGAERAFELFARAHERHDYADNALYWKGEAAYDQEQFDEALTAFTEVVERYGGGNKAPDALLKIGLCYGKLGDDANARDVLTGLVEAYPDARAADIARNRLAELGG